MGMFGKQKPKFGLSPWTDTGGAFSPWEVEMFAQIVDSSPSSSPRSLPTISMPRPKNTIRPEGHIPSVQRSGRHRIT